MAIALVNHVKLFGATTPLTITTSAVNMTGATLLVFIASGKTPVGSFTVSDSTGANTWTALAKLTSADAGNDLQMFYAVNPTVGATQTFTLTIATGNFPTIMVLGFSGTSTVSSVFDAQTSHLTLAATTTVAPGAIVPAVAGEVFVTAGMNSNGGISLSINDGFTITDSDQTGTYEVGGAAYSISPVGDTFVQTKDTNTVGGGNTTASLAWDSPVTAGNALIVLCTSNNYYMYEPPGGSPGLPLTVTDSLGNTYTKVIGPLATSSISDSTDSNAFDFTIWVCKSAFSGSNTVTATVTGGTVNGFNLAILEFAGSVVAPFESVADTLTVTPSAPYPNIPVTLTTLYANDTVFLFTQAYGGGSGPAGFTAHTTGGYSGFSNFFYKVIPTPGTDTYTVSGVGNYSPCTGAVVGLVLRLSWAVNPTWTFSGNSGATGINAVMATFGPPGPNTFVPQVGGFFVGI